MNEKDNLAIKALTLARLVPVEWDEFMQAFNAYANLQRDMLINSPVDALPTSQGVARGVAALFDLCRDCKTIAAKIQRVS